MPVIDLRQLEKIIRNHNPEHDVGEPYVTWAEAALARAVLSLERKITDSENLLPPNEEDDPFRPLLDKIRHPHSRLEDIYLTEAGSVLVFEFTDVQMLITLEGVCTS